MPWISGSQTVLHIWIIWEALNNSTVQGTSLVIQWLGLRTPNVGGTGLIPELRSGMLHSACSLKIKFHCPDYTPLQLDHFLGVDSQEDDWNVS